MQEDLDSEQRRLATYSESDRSLDDAVADGYRGADAILRRAGAEANEALQRAVDERRMLVNEVQRLRDERQELQDEIASLRRNGLVAVPQPVETLPAFDLETAIAEEMRALLVEILADFRSRAAAPPPEVQHAAAEIETKAEVVAEAPEPILEEIVEDVKTLSLSADVVTETAPIETFESIVEHVDELVRPASSEPIVDEYVEELRSPKPMAPVEDYVEEFLRPEAPPSIEEIDLEAALPETAPPVAEEHVFQPMEPAEPAAPIVDDYVEDLRRPEPPSWIETIELNATPAEPIVDEPEVLPIETVEMNAPQAGPIEPLVDPVEELRHDGPIVDDYVVPASEVTITPSAPLPAPDARIDALWEAASSPMTEAETAPLTPFEPASSFMTPELIAETRPLEIPEAPPAPEELAPEPPIELAPEPPVEFAPEPPAIVEPEPEARSEPLIIEPAPAETSASAFPELRVADERGLHHIQVVISPIHSFPRLLETERRIRALSTVNALHLRDFRNGVATFVVAVAEAISPAEFGAVIQMLESLHLRLEGTTQSSVELHAEDEPATD